MAQLGVRHVFGVAVAAAVAMACGQVSAVPAPPAMATPSLDSVVSHVRSEAQWFRTEIPRSPGWWSGAAQQSSGDMRELVKLLSAGPE